jgi:hypothetical protein
MGRSNKSTVYQIELLDFTKRSSGRSTDAVIPDSGGLYFCYKCEWEGKREPQCPVCGNSLVPKGKVKLVDTMPIAARRTIVTQPTNKNKESIKRWAARFGTVISCRKVDSSPYTQNIEYLNLKQEPIVLEVERDEFVLTEDLELERPQKNVE